MRPPRPRRKREQKLILQRAGAWKRGVGLSKQLFSDLDIEEIRQYGYREFHRRATAAGMEGFPTPERVEASVAAFNARKRLLRGKGWIEKAEIRAGLDYSKPWLYEPRESWLTKEFLEATSAQAADQLLKELGESGIVVPY